MKLWLKWCQTLKGARKTRRKSLSLGFFGEIHQGHNCVLELTYLINAYLVCDVWWVEADKKRKILACLSYIQAL